MEPLTARLNARAEARLANGDFGDDGHGGQTHAQAYIDDCGAAVPLQDVSFFLDEFVRLGTPYGCLLNSVKTRILTSTSSESALPLIEVHHGHQVADDIHRAIATYSITEVTAQQAIHLLPTLQSTFGTCISDPIRQELQRLTEAEIANNSVKVVIPEEVTTGLRLLGQPLGSTAYASSFFEQRLKDNIADATKLLDKVPDLHTALGLFAQCTLHKLPHLLGSEVMYCFDNVEYKQWDEWCGQLAIGIDNMVDYFLSRITARDSIPFTSRLIAYITIAQGGLGLMDAHTRAIPDFVLTMSQSIRYASHGFAFSANESNYMLPLSLRSLFNFNTNQSSKFLCHFNRLLPDVALAGTHTQCQDPLAR